jgi:hypothetical protein
MGDTVGPSEQQTPRTDQRRGNAPGKKYYNINRNFPRYGFLIVRVFCISEKSVMPKSKAYWEREAKAIEAGNKMLAGKMDKMSEELLLTRQAVKDVKQLNAALEMTTALLLSFWLYHTQGQPAAQFDMELTRDWLIEQDKIGVQYYRKNAMQSAFEDVLLK